MQGAQIRRNEAYLSVRRNDRGCSATPQMNFFYEAVKFEETCFPNSIMVT